MFIRLFINDWKRVCSIFVVVRETRRSAIVLLNTKLKLNLIDSLTVTVLFNCTSCTNVIAAFIAIEGKFTMSYSIIGCCCAGVWNTVFLTQYSPYIERSVETNGFYNNMQYFIVSVFAVNRVMLWNSQCASSSHFWFAHWCLRQQSVHRKKSH